MISANAIFHYTKEKAWLKSIINDNFIPRLSTEDISWALPKEMTGENFEDWKSIKIPMVCFCDIPLSQVLSHADEYGDYAIGLTKEWAIKHKICPIIYSYPESDIAGIFHQMVLASSLGTGAMAMISGLVDLFQKKKEDKQEEVIVKTRSKFEAYEKILDSDWFCFIQFAKPYSEGNIKTGKEKKFYDEREWRYIPKSETMARSYISTKEFEDNNKPKGLEQYIKSIEDHRLIFEPDDVRYIIVKDEEDVADFVKEIRNCERFRKTNVNSFDSLFTRILSMERIRQDF